MTTRNLLAVATVICLSLIVGAAAIFASPVSRWDENRSELEFTKPMPTRLSSIDAALSFDGSAVDFDLALSAGADYLQGMQADVTEDNAGNGTDGVDETPDDPDDGGWDWTSTTFSHSTSASPTNIYGATAMGLYYAYLETGDAGYFTAMQDAADFIVAAIPPAPPRSGGDMKFLLLFNDLYSSVVAPTTVYADVARAKYDDRIAVYGSATAFAEVIRDFRGVTNGYPNGIIAWDVGIFAVIAQKLYDVYGGTYDVDADAIAEVLWEDSFNDNPGYFDIVDDAGWDPTYMNKNFWWYNIGLTGLIDAFDAAGTHTSEIPGLVTLLLDGVADHGAVSFCYGVHEGDYDLQSTAYAMSCLGNLDQATYQTDINSMGYFAAATQDASGGWMDYWGDYTPEVCGETTAGLYFTTNVTAYDLSDVLVDASFTWQGDVDVYNSAHSTSYIWGYNAFATIQEGIDAVDGSTVHVAAGTYAGNINIDKSLTMIGDPGDANPGPGANAPVIDGGSAPGDAFLIANGVTNVTIEGFEMRNFTSPLLNGIGNGISAWEASTSNITIRDNYFHHLGYNGVLVGNDGAAGDHTNWLIKNNIIEDFGYIGFELTNTSNSSIEDNVIHMMTPYIGAIFSSARRSETGLTIKNNLIDGSPSTLYPVIYMYAYDLDMANPNLNSVLIEGNAITTIGTPSQIYIRDIGTGTITGVTVVNNNLLSLKNATPETLDASPNWWGDLDPSDQVVGDVVYYPCWDDASMTTLFYPPVHNVTQDTYFSAIQPAIDAADPGDVINVAAGTYVEALLINKPLTLLGATAGINKNGYTVPAGYAWDDAVETIIMHPNPAVAYMTIVDIYDTDDVMFDGFVVQELSATGNLNSSLLRVYAVTKAISNINVINSIIGPNTNTVFQDGTHGRMGLYIVNHPYGDNGVTNSTFAGNKIFDCKGNGDNVFLWSSYFSYGAPGPASMAGTVIEDNEIYGAHRSGIETAGGFSDLVIRNNEIYANSELPGDVVATLKYGHGIQLIRGSSDKVSDPLTAFGPVNLTIEGNNIHDNSKCGIYMGPKNDQISIINNTISSNGWDGIMVDLVGNYWNPQFESPPTSEAYACYDCTNDVSAYHNSIYGNGTAGYVDAEFGVHVNGAATNSFVFDAEENWWGTISGAAIDAMTSGAIDFTPWCTDATHTDCTVTSNISLTSTSALLKCGDMETLWLDVSAGVTGVEAASFKIGFDHNVVTPTGVVKAPPYDVSGMFLSFNIDLAADSMGIDVGITEGAFDGPGYLIGIAYTAVGEAASTDFTFERSVLRDGSNQDISHETSNTSVTIDCTLPEAPAGLVVLPGHEKVKLSWTNPTGDPSFAGVEIRRNPWAVGAYPEYDDDGPAMGYPASETEGDLVYQGTDEAFNDANNTTLMPRNVYYYTILAYDLAGNYSAVTAVQQGRATNYWLGDVGGLGLADGNVYYGDLLVFSNTYGNSEGDPSYEAEFDIGPTVTGSPRGIPTTDNIVNFEDLAIFAINFNVVGPSLKVVPIFEDVPINGPLAVALYRPAQQVAVGDQFTVSVSLQNNPGTVKALAFDLAYDPSELELVEQHSSADLQNSSAPIFYNGRVSNRGVEIALALLGGANTIGGSGELSQATFRVLKPEADVRLENVDARDAQNQKLTVYKDNSGSAPGSQLPGNYALAQNYPNPFNPTTNLAFSLPKATDVRLEVINVLGQRVALLFDGIVEAGEHVVEWDARGQASGVYFYKLTAGDFVQTKKMMLLR